MPWSLSPTPLKFYANQRPAVSSPRRSHPAGAFPGFSRLLATWRHFLSLSPPRIHHETRRQNEAIERQPGRPAPAEAWRERESYLREVLQDLKLAAVRRAAPRLLQRRELQHLHLRSPNLNLSQRVPPRVVLYLQYRIHKLRIYPRRNINRFQRGRWPFEPCSVDCGLLTFAAKWCHGRISGSITKEMDQRGNI